jgi:hypothetical protein
METPITWTHLQWLVGLGMPLLLAALSWIGAELVRLRQTREADRKTEALQREEDRKTAATARAFDQAHHDNDLRDLWQALNMLRRDSAESAKEAAHFRETIIAAIGDIKASLAVFNARHPEHQEPRQ